MSSMDANASTAGAMGTVQKFRPSAREFLSVCPGVLRGVGARIGYPVDLVGADRVARERRNECRVDAAR